MASSVMDIFKNISGAAASPLTNIQQTATQTGAKLQDSAETLTQVAEGYAAIQLLISLASLGVAWGMLDMYKKTYALHSRRYSRLRKKNR